MRGTDAEIRSWLVLSVIAVDERGWRPPSIRLLIGIVLIRIIG